MNLDHKFCYKFRNNVTLYDRYAILYDVKCDKKRRLAFFNDNENKQMMTFISFVSIKSNESNS